MLSITRIAAFFVAAFCFSHLAFAQTNKFSKDQKKLLKEALTVALVTEKNFPEYADLTNKTKVIIVDSMVSVDDYFKKPIVITPKVLPKLDKVKLDLQSEAEIVKNVQKEDQLFIRVGQIAEPTSDYALVHVFGEWDLGQNSLDKGYKFRQADGYTLLFKKEGNDWKYQKIVNRLPNLFKQR